MKEYQVACQNGTVTTEQFDTIMHKASASAVEYSAKIKAGTGTAQSYASAQRATNSALQEVSIGAGIASKAIKLFSAALNMIAFTAIIQGIGWLIGKVDDLIVTAKEAKEAANAFKESLSTFFSETQSNLKTISSLSDRFGELSKNVDDNGKKIGGTEEEYAEFLDICQQVGQIMPELITGYTNEGEAIITLQGKVDSLTDSYKEAIKAKAALFISQGDEEGNTIDSFFEDYDNFINGYKGLWDLKLSPSGQNSLEYFEEYYGYDKIHEWLSKVKDATLDELNNLEGELATAQRGDLYLAKILSDSNFDINDITEENYNAIHDVLNNRFTIMEKELSNRVLNIRSAFQNMLYADSDYWNIDDDNVISAINSLYSSIDAEFIKQNNLFNQNALQTFESNFISLFNNDDIKQAMVDFYTPIAANDSVNDYTKKVRNALETIQIYCEENGIKIPIEISDNDTINTSKRLHNSIRQITDDHGISEREEYATLSEYTKDFTQAQAEMWLEVTLGARNATEAVRMYEDALAKVPDTKVSLSISSTISQLNTQLKPAFDSLQSAYQSIFTSDGFTLNSIDILSTCDSIKSKLDDMAELGLTVDYSSYEDFVKVLSDSESTSQDVETAFDSLATSITQAALTGKEDFSTMKAALEDLGVLNNEIVAFDALISNTEALKEAGLDLADATDEQITAFAEAMVSAENYDQAINLLRMQKILCNENPLSAAEDINELYRLAQAAGIATNAIQQLMGLNSAYEMAAESGNTIASTAVKVQMDMVRKQVIDQFSRLRTDVDFSDIGGGASKAKSAGKDAGKSYADALKDELSNLNSVINYIGDTIDRQIDLFEDQKDAAVDALEAEKEAAEEALEAEKELVQEKIDAKQAEIDAIEDAAEARKNELDLQKAQYDLERMLNQKTMLVNYMPDTIVI